MTLKTIKDENFGDYKLPSMLIAAPYCSGKCYKELGMSPEMCQNTALKSMPNMSIPNEKIVERYLSNPLTKAICFGGLEPLEQIEELIELTTEFRKYTDDPIVIYTGYNIDELPVIRLLELCTSKKVHNVILKVGRYTPSLEHRFDEILGVTLASNNQYAIKIN